GGDPGDRVEGAPAADLRFGCDPGPALPPLAESEPILPPATEWLAAPEIATVKVGDRQHLPSVSRRPIDGVGFNLEHALWSCDRFRAVFQDEILAPFQPAVVRFDLSPFPLADAGTPRVELNFQGYQAVLDSPLYA